MKAMLPLDFVSKGVSLMIACTGSIQAGLQPGTAQSNYLAGSLIEWFSEHPMTIISTAACIASIETLCSHTGISLRFNHEAGLYQLYAAYLGTPHMWEANNLMDVLSKAMIDLREAAAKEGKTL